jgi:hypothetical protein
MAHYKVIDPKGVFNGEKTLPKGEIFSLEQPTSRLRAWIRFKQVEETKPSPDPDKAAADKAAADKAAADKAAADKAAADKAAADKAAADSSKDKKSDEIKK